jgi:hypothetical protein
MEGLKRLVNESKHRKELVAGGLAQYLVAGALNSLQQREFLPICMAEYHRLANLVGSRAGDFWSVFLDSHNDRIFRPLRLFTISLSELPLVRSGSPIFQDKLIP